MGNRWGGQTLAGGALKNLGRRRTVVFAVLFSLALVTPMAFGVGDAGAQRNKSGLAASDLVTGLEGCEVAARAPQPNNPPIVTPLTGVMIDYSTPHEFAASATDSDGDALRYSWSFGDGSQLVVGNPVTHTYSLPGVYTFTVYVDDSNQNNVSSSATASITFPLKLKVGWNLISVPVVGNHYRASTMGLGSVGCIVRFDSASRTYRKYQLGIPFTDFAILPGEGYWIYAASAKTLHLYGTVPTETQIVTITVPVGGGWALIGFATLKTTLKGSDVPGMYDPIGSVILVVAYRDPGYIVLVFPSPIPKDFPLVPGEGYWMYVSSSGTITYDP